MVRKTKPSAPLTTFWIVRDLIPDVMCFTLSEPTSPNLGMETPPAVAVDATGWLWARATFESLPSAQSRIAKAPEVVHDLFFFLFRERVRAIRSQDFRRSEGLSGMWLAHDFFDCVPVHGTRGSDAHQCK
jgi:hypothetical protein